MSFNFDEFCQQREKLDGAPLDDRVRVAIARIQNTNGETVILKTDEAREIIRELLELREEKDK